MRTSATSTTQAREIAENLKGFTVVITKSTVPVGTGDDVERIIAETNPRADVIVASNPEIPAPRAPAIRDFKHPDRIVVGTEDERARKVIAEIYRPLYLNQAPIMYTGRRTAELIKYGRQRLSCHQNYLHQRNRRPRRARRSRRAGGCARHRPRQSDRQQISACRPRLRRLVLPKDTARWSRPLRIMVCHCASSRPCSRSTIAQARRWRASRGDARRQSAQQDHRRAGPGVQAEYRRHARSTLDPTHHALQDLGAMCRPMIRSAWTRQDWNCPMSPIVMILTAARRKRTPW